ncbi:unnamed protein product [Nippostrongylus brasiliensis]|uniref:Serine carboxypeptidase n=1 Tax=Nippostrongylus brasiliensis TaxID=27835 RepID=A0A0N4Y576_NIPBR|nr:unnamed protein product [Nippostrongylus brasiliensis]
MTTENDGAEALKKSLVRRSIRNTKESCWETSIAGLDFLTVRGAGHFPAASSEKPKEALQLVVNFLRGTSYSTPIIQLPTTTISSTSASSTTSASTEVPVTSSTSQMPSTSTKHDKGAYSCSVVQVVVFMVGLLLFK